MGGHPIRAQIKFACSLHCALVPPFKGEPVEFVVAQDLVISIKIKENIVHGSNVCFISASCAEGFVDFEDIDWFLLGGFCIFDSLNDCIEEGVGNIIQNSLT